MKKLFNVMMLFAALAIGFTSCKEEENNDDNNDNNNTEVKGDYCYDVYLLDDFSKLVTNESLIDTKQTAKGWIRNTEETASYVYDAAEGDTEKMIMTLVYVHTPSRGDAFVYGMTGYTAGTMTTEGAAQLLNLYGFTEDAQSGTLEGGIPAVVALHPTRDIQLMIYWEPSEQNPDIEVVVYQFSAPY